MVVEKELLPYLVWLIGGPTNIGALPIFLFLIVIVGMVSILFCYFVTATRVGPVEAFYLVAQVIAGSIPDFLKTSPRRTWAMARLAIKESVRRKVIVGFVIFSVLLLYAGWFFDVNSDHPAKLYLSVTLTATNFLVLALGLLLSTLSLPADIKSRTIYTVVTKPVRATEIILGRILGFMCVGTILLVMMGLISYGFVVRNLSHPHGLPVKAGEIEAALAKDGVWRGVTTMNKLHRHEVVITREQWERDGYAITETEREHWHAIRKDSQGRFVVGRPNGQLQARVPVYGKLRFLERNGTQGKGVNVGNEWTYRSYVEGGTLAAAIWTYEGVTPERFPDGLPLEMNIRIFRTHKGDIERGVIGTIVVKNGSSSARIQASTPYNFEAKEFTIVGHKIPRKLQALDSATGEVKDVDLFKDFVRDGKLEIWVQCSERGQYFGVAQADVYLRAENRPFEWNFAKAYMAIWLELLLVICFGVTFSTFLSGPIAILATLGQIILGLRAAFIAKVFGGVIVGNQLLAQAFGWGDQTAELPGGGPIESMIRLATQANVTSDLDMHWITELIVKWTDFILMCVMWAVTQTLPNLTDFFYTSNYVAYGFNIDGNLLLQLTTISFAFAFVLTIVGYFFLKTREIAA